MATQDTNRHPLEGLHLNVYANRWIAVVRGQICGVGATADQAYRMAKQARPKRNPQLFYIGEQGRRMIGQEWLYNQPLLQQVAQILRGQHIEAYLVGGAVRDLLLERHPIVDFDFAVPSNGLGVARLVAKKLAGAYYPLDVERGTGRVICSDALKSQLDFATFRGDTLLADLADRDFTINALALRLADPPELMDPFQGQVDLQMGRIQAVSQQAFLNDPVRTLRAVRQAVAFGFAIETKTTQFIRQAADQLPTVSPERQRDELMRLLNTPAPGQAVQQLHQLEILPHILPEVADIVDVEQSPPHYLDVFNHTTTALDIWAGLQKTIHSASPAGGLTSLINQWSEPVRDYLQENLAGNLTIQNLLPLALLLHDTGKPATQSWHNGHCRFLGHEAESAKISAHIMNRFRFSGQATNLVVKTVANHMRPLALANSGRASRRAIYRLFRDTTDQTIQAGLAVALHALADHRATYPPGEGQAAEAALISVVDKLFQAYFEQSDQLVNPTPLLNGRDLINHFGLQEGRLIGQLLSRLREAQAIGAVTTPEAALEFIQSEIEARPEGTSNRG